MLVVNLEQYPQVQAPSGDPLIENPEQAKDSINPWNPLNFQYSFPAVDFAGLSAVGALFGAGSMFENITSCNAIDTFLIASFERGWGWAIGQPLLESAISYSVFILYLWRRDEDDRVTQYIANLNNELERIQNGYEKMLDTKNNQANKITETKENAFRIVNKYLRSGNPSIYFGG